MIKFKTLKITGFKSIQSMNFDLTQQGINIITGENGNGKTTIFESLFWGLFGKTLKGGNKDSIETLEKYKPKNYKGTQVLLSFVDTLTNTEYFIVRHLNFKEDFINGIEKIKTGNKLLIFQDGELISENSHKSNSQEFINNVLKVDDKTFLNCVLYGQRMKRLIENDSQTKYDVLNQFFDLDFIDDLKQKAINYKKQNEDKKNTLNVRLSIIENKIKSLISERERYYSMATSFEVEKIQRINKTKESIQILENELKEIGEIKGELVYYEIDETALKQIESIKIKYQSEQTEISNIIKAHENEIRHLLIESERLNNQLHTNQQLYKKDLSKCIYCDGVLNEQKQIEQKNKLVAENENLSTKISDLNSLIGQIKQQIEIQKFNFKELSNFGKENNEKLSHEQSTLRKFKDLNREIEQHNREIRLAKTKIQTIQSNVLFLQNQLIEIEAQQFTQIDIDFNTEIEVLEIEEQKIESKIEVLNEVIKICDFWISKGFSNSGLKSYMVNSMLSLLNIEVEKYGQILGIYLKFSVSLEGSRKTFNTQCIKTDNVEIDYQELSGGEKSRIDLALCLGLFDLFAKVKQQFNILIFDEAFENLDEKGSYDIMEMIRQKALTTNIFIITHDEKIDHYGCNLITISKQNNQTQL